MSHPAAVRIDEPIALPAPAPPPRRAPWPLLASLVPVAGGVGMWLLTGNIVSLCFAALGPLMAIASLVDGRRGSKRERRRAEADYAAACDRISEEVAARHAHERDELDAELVDVRALLDDERRVWRVASDELVVGRGAASSRVRVTGGEGEPAERVRRTAAVLDDAPIAIALDEGVCVRGDGAPARAVARALVLQACLRAHPSSLALVSVPDDEEWCASLPHRRREAGAGAREIVFAIEPAAVRGGGTVVAVVPSGSPVPDACGAIIEMEEGMTGRLLRGTHAVALSLEGISLPQARSAAAALGDRGAAVAEDAAPPQHLLGTLEPVASGAGLPAVVGLSHGGAAVVDIVEDGPHAMVVGTTGAGKSELLITWVASLARTFTPDRVVFLLADFKGGTAFDGLAALPHATGVITDLDAEASRRAVESLRAEVRRREAHLAARGLRDVSSPDAGLPRLVIVVDEFAAMLQDHPDLHAVFSDVAARGRALGMHLVLGTQRSTGVMRDALAANCPLRIALRVSETSESRAVVGTDDAAALPGDADGRGLAYVRRAADSSPRLTRIALTTPADLAPLAVSADHPRAVGPWLPPLPAELPLDRVRSGGGAGGADALVLGLADEPERQRQPPVLLRPGVDRGLAAIGGSGSGKSTLVRLLRAQAPEAVVVPRDAEGAWDAIERVEHEGGGLLLVDDLDALLARFPHEHAQIVAERLEGIVRDAGERRTSIVVTAARATGAVARILDLLPRRALLALASRADHATAGGDSASFDPRRRPGRAVLDGREVQFAVPPASAAPGPAETVDQRWVPTAPLTALVVRAAHRRCIPLADAWGEGVRIVPVDGLPPGGRLADLVAGADRVVVAGDPEAWQRQWALLQEAKATTPLVVGAECATEVRALTGERETPPYARTRASRAWLFAEGRPPVRIVLP